MDGVDLSTASSTWTSAPTSRSDLKVLKPHGVLAAYSSPAEPEPKLPFYALMRNNVTVRAVLIYTGARVGAGGGYRDIVPTRRGWRSSTR